MLTCSGSGTTRPRLRSTLRWPGLVCRDRPRELLPARWQSGGNVRICSRASAAKFLISLLGRVAEWFKAPVLKTGRGATLSWVRIPPRPPRLSVTRAHDLSKDHEDPAN